MVPLFDARDHRFHRAFDDVFKTAFGHRCHLGIAADPYSIPFDLCLGQKACAMLPLKQAEDKTKCHASVENEVNTKSPQPSSAGIPGRSR